MGKSTENSFYPAGITPRPHPRPRGSARVPSPRLVASRPRGPTAGCRPPAHPHGGARSPRPAGGAGSRERGGLEPLPWEKVSERVRIQMRRLSMLSARRAPARGWARSWRGSERSGLGRRSPGRPRPRPPLHTHARTRTHSRAQTHFPSLRALYLSFLAVRFHARSPPPLPFIISRLELYL